ncbi:MAG: hypothetical protein ACR2IF_03205 [Terriglobales bacterium]
MQERSGFSFLFTPLWGAVLVLALTAMVAGGYSWHEHNMAKQLTTEKTQISAALHDTQSQLGDLSNKVNAMSAAEAERERAAAVARERAARSAKVVGHHRTRAEDKRFKEIQAKLDAQGKAIDDTRNDLSSAKTELSGSIARTHGELMALAAKGERSYFEFDMDRTKQFRSTGPVGIKLKKANTKHQFADLDLMVDDATLNQKHVNLLQPVVFYAYDGGRPIELVVNKISKNHIHGYVSTPKYKQSELAAMQAQNAQANGEASAAVPQRQRLEVPKD